MCSSQRAAASGSLCLSLGMRKEATEGDQKREGRGNGARLSPKLTWSGERGGAVSRDSQLPRMAQSTYARPRKPRNTWPHRSWKCGTLGRPGGDTHTHLSSGRHQNTGSPVAAAGSKTLLGAELEMELVRGVAEILLNLCGEEMCGTTRHAVFVPARGACGVSAGPASFHPERYAAWVRTAAACARANLTVDYIFTEDSLVCPFIGLICN